LLRSHARWYGTEKAQGEKDKRMMCRFQCDPSRKDDEDPCRNTAALFERLRTPRVGLL